MTTRYFKGKCATRHEIIVTYLWERQEWIPAHELIKLELRYGTTGSSGDVRARELARNDCPEKLKDKVERAEGRDIGLDRRFTYFRYREAERPLTRAQHLRIAEEAVAAFDAA